MKGQPSHYHFVGIGGVGMGTIALLLLAKGFRVSGSDIKESEFTLRLRKEGAAIFIGHTAKNVGEPDSVVYSSAISPDNPELIFARAKKIPILQRAQLLAKLMESHKGITVAGAHGKTTTTSLISNLLIKAGLQPTTAIGGVINGGAYHANLGSGEYFVAEVDESDGSFLYFSPHYSVITNIDFEHVDYYGNWDNIMDAYTKFIVKTRPGGHIFACGDDQRLQNLLKTSKRKFTLYGFSESNDVVAKNLMTDGYFSSYDCVFKNRDIGPIQLRIPGKHNICNSLACVCVGMTLGIDPEVIRKSLSDFRGANRRFQLKGNIHDIIVVDDYGHHPSEITATIEAARTFKKKRLIVVFQPHRYTRTKFLMEEFAKSLSLCDYLIMTDIYAASEEPIEGVSAQKLCEKIRTLSQIPVIYLKKENILSHLVGMVDKGDIVLTLGAGDINRISDELVKRLSENKKMESPVDISGKAR